MAVVSEIVADWTTTPFVNVRVQDSPCSSGDSIFNHHWSGTHSGCEADNGDIRTYELAATEKFEDAGCSGVSARSG